MRMFSLVLLAAASLAACSPYDPDLGTKPFLCGPADQDPRCPAGYECETETMMGSGSASMTREVCVVPVVIPPDAPDNCADDSALEPNDNKETAWMTPVDSTLQPFTLAQLAICPGGDKDQYRVQISTANRNIEMIIEYEEEGAELQGAIANATGVPITNASATGANTKRAYAPNQPIGVYFVQVFGPATGDKLTNNYKVTITASGP
jgi:hypothetical protein